MNFDYDYEQDVLYASVGEPQKATTIYEGNGVLLRVNSDTNDVIGFTVLNYMARIEAGLLKEIKYFEQIELPKYEKKQN
jgi:uncharacterized protein YuzE